MRPAQTTAAGLLFLALCPAVLAADRPNILWITSEDNGPHLGCYGDRYSTSPELDRLASRGTLYLNCWSVAPVCAPARTAIISGMYPSSTGSEHMRSQIRLPAGMQMYPQLLRAAGYYCTNNSKEDYNLAKPGIVWDESSPRAHWKNRTPGQPFFAIFNITVTHESQIRARPHRAVHDPAQVRLPAYHPEAPEVRQDWAQYYDKITEMDRIAGRHLAELAEAGLADDTIVFYYGDHGPGMPRCKRWPYNSGLHVPLIVHIPEKHRTLAPPDYAPGGRSKRLVSFVDLAPSVLSLAGLEPPPYQQGRAFLGPFAALAPTHVHGLRGRMDERYDLVRSVRNERYVYIRNYMPHLIYGQHVAYMFQTPTTRIWKQLWDVGRLTPAQARFWRPKPPEELYDLEADPDEVHNLADSAAHRAILDQLRRAQREQVLRVRDIGLLPEAEMHRRAADSTPYEVGHDDTRYPLAHVLDAAEWASSLHMDVLSKLRDALGDPDSGVRYWAALGIHMRGPSALAESRPALLQALADPSPSVRIAAAQALAQHGTESDLARALPVLVELASFQRHGLYVTMHALNALDALGRKAGWTHESVRTAFEGGERIDSRLREYIPRLLDAVATIDDR
jgi:uncharacterized sulfatase